MGKRAGCAPLPVEEKKESHAAFMDILTLLMLGLVASCVMV